MNIPVFTPFPEYNPPAGVALLRVSGGSLVQISFNAGKEIIGSGLILIARKAVSSGHVTVDPAGGDPSTI